VIKNVKATFRVTSVYLDTRTRPIVSISGTRGSWVAIRPPVLFWVHHV